MTQRVGEWWNGSPSVGDIASDVELACSLFPFVKVGLSSDDFREMRRAYQSLNLDPLDVVEVFPYVWFTHPQDAVQVKLIMNLPTESQ